MISKTLTKIKRYWWIVIIAGAIIALIAWLIDLRQQGSTWLPFTGFEGKTIWDFAELLIIPITLAVVAAYLDRLERKADQENSKDNQREAALQNYFDAMTKLMLDNDLRHSKRGDEIREIARVKTLTTLERLDGERKGKLIGFIYDIGLIKGNIETVLPIISLEGAHLEGAHLVGAHLVHVYLEGAHLRGVHLEGAHLGNAHLESAYLEGAHLMGATLVDAHLEDTYLEGAHLEFAHMPEAHLLGAHLEFAHLEFAYLEGANLKDAKYNKDTKWPDNFDPKAAGAIEEI